MPQEGDNEDGGSVDNHNLVARCVFVIDLLCVLVWSPSVRSSMFDFSHH